MESIVLTFFLLVIGFSWLITKIDKSDKASTSQSHRYKDIDSRYEEDNYDDYDDYYDNMAIDEGEAADHYGPV